MKKAIISFATLLMIVSCNNKEKEIGWIISADKLIDKYDRSYPTATSSIDSFYNGLNTKFMFYNKHRYGIEKIEVKYAIDSLMDINEVFYLKDNVLLKTVLEGKSPLVYKRKRLEDEPTHEMGIREIYFFDKDSSIMKAKSIQLKGPMSIDSVKAKLDKIEYSITYPGSSYYENYERTLVEVKAIKLISISEEL